MSAGAWIRPSRRNAPVRPVPVWVWVAVLGFAALAGLSVTTPVVAVALLGGVGLFVLLRRIFLHPHTAFVYALLLFPFYTFLRGAALAYHVPLPAAVVGMWPEVLLCVMMAGILCQRIRAREKLRVSWDDMPVVLLLVSTLYGVVISIMEKDAVAVVYGFHQSVTPFLFFFVARWLPVSPAYLHRLVRLWLVPFCVLAALSFVDYALRPAFIIKIVVAMRPGFNGPFDPYDFYRWYPRMQSLLFAEQVWGTVCVFPALYSIIALQEKRPLKTRLLLWVTCFLSLTGLLCSMSRGSFVCFAAGAGILLCFRGRHRRTLLTMVLTLALVAGLAYARFSGDPRVKSLSKRTGALVSMATGGSGVAVTSDGKIDTSNSATNRVSQWTHALESFPIYPAGRGLGRAGTAAVLHNASINVNDAVSDGGYFRILAEAGLFGIVGFLAGMAGVMHVLLHRLLRDRRFVNGEDRTIALTLFAYAAGLLVQEVGGDVFGFYYIIPLFWLLLGLLLSRRDAAIAAAASVATALPLPIRQIGCNAVPTKPPLPVSFGDLYDTGKNNFNVLRLVLAVLVIFSHCFPMIWAPPHNFEPLDVVSRHHFTLGTLSVDAFFVISGFLISASWEHSRNVWDFALRRILRVYPGYLVCLFFCALVVGPLSNGNAADYFAQLRTHSVASIFRLQDLPGVFPNTPLPRAVNGSLWTIRYEIYCYILLAVVGMVTKLRRLPVLLVWGFCYLGYNVLVPVWASRVGPLPGPLGEEWLPRLTTYFFAGSAFWAWRKSLPASPQAITAALVVFFGGLVILPHWLVPLAGTYALMGAAFSRRVRFYDFGKRLDLSYGIYLYAFPLQQLLTQRFLPYLTPLTLFVTALPLTVLAAWVSWSFVEKPFLRIKSGKIKPHTTPEKFDTNGARRVS